MQLKEHSTVKLLKTLPKEEIERLNKFISSPYFNSNKNIANFFTQLIKFYPQFEGKDFNKEAFYNKIFNDKPYNDSNFRWIMSEITGLTEKYLAQIGFERDALMQNYYLIENHFKNQRKVWVKKSLTTSEKNLSEHLDKDYVYFFHKYVHFTNEMSYKMVFTNDKKTTDLDFLYQKFLKALISYINHFILGVAYDYLNADLMFTKYHKNGISKKINDIIKILNFNKISDYIKNDNEDSSTLSGLLFLLNMYLELEKDTHYTEFKKYVEKNRNSVSQAQLGSYYSKMISYCRLKIVNGAHEDFYRGELFETSKRFITNKYYKDDKTKNLSSVLYRIILENALELDKLDYAEILVEKENTSIIKEHRLDAVNYGRGLIQFYKGSFDDALESLSKVDTSFFALDQKALRIMLFIEKKYYYECRIEIKSFKKFLQTNKFLSENLRTNWGNFLFFISFLSNDRNGSEQVNKKMLRDLMKEKKPVYYKKWLIKKINGL